MTEAADAPLTAADIPPDLVRVLSVAPVMGDRRTPVAVARVMVGGLVVTFSLHGRRKGAFAIRPPYGADAAPGVAVISEAVAERLATLLQEAAEADPVVLAHLRQAPPSRSKTVAA